MKVIATRRGHAPWVMGHIISADGVRNSDGTVSPGDVFECPDHQLALITDDPACGWMKAADPEEHDRREAKRVARPSQGFAAEPAFRGMQSAVLKDGTR